MTTQKRRAAHDASTRAHGSGADTPSTARRGVPPLIPRLAYSPEEAAKALGVSRDYLDEHVMPELRVVRKGRRRLVPLREIERWLSENAHRAGE